MTMLVQCLRCEAIISNDCDECPWCRFARQPLTEVKPKKQISLFALIVIVSIVGTWLGLALRDSLR